MSESASFESEGGGVIFVGRGMAVVVAVIVCVTVGVAVRVAVAVGVIASGVSPGRSVPVGVGVI